MGAEITERRVSVDGIGIFCREIAGSGPPTIFVHGNPTNSGDWLPFLERMNGPAIAFDLPGFGRSDRPDPARFDHTIEAYAQLLDKLFDQLAPDGFKLVVHDWGGLGLIAALRRPERVRGIVAINTVPIASDYRWHWIAQIWRRRGLGELFNAVNTKFATAQLLRLARYKRRRVSPEFVDMVWSGWGPGMSRAVLALYRSADPEVIRAEGARLGELRCPALIVWGQNDPYIGPEHGRAFAAAIPGAELIEVERASHWPWIDRPEMVDRVVAFVDG